MCINELYDNFVSIVGNRGQLVVGNKTFNWNVIDVNRTW